MKYNLCQIVQFLFWFQIITAALGSVFFHIIQKIRCKYKQSLPTRFHCILLKSALTFFFAPNTVLLYIFASMHHFHHSPVQNNMQTGISHSLSFFQFFILTISTVGILKRTFRYVKLSIQLNHYSRSVSYQTTDPAIINLSVSIRKRYGIKRTLPIYIHPYIPSPSITGILCPKILLPENVFQQADRNTLQIILSHEILHYKKKDIFWYYFCAVIQCIYWYLPSVKTLCTEIKNWLEYECDERCCKENQKQYTKQDYFNTILDLLYNEKYTNHCTSGINFYKNKYQVEDRILHMHTKKETTEKKPLFCLFILLTLLSAYLFFLILALVISLHLL